MGNDPIAMLVNVRLKKCGTVLFNLIISPRKWVFIISRSSFLFGISAIGNMKLSVNIAANAMLVDIRHRRPVYALYQKN